MARQKKEIDPEQGRRLSMVCELEGLSQRALGEAIEFPQQYINRMINGKVPVSPAVADAIHERFPLYRADWLRNIDPYMTEGQLFAHALADRWEEGNAIQGCLLAYAGLAGYEITAVSPCKKVEDGRVPVEEVIKSVRDGYEVRHGGKVARLSIDRMNDLANEVYRFAAFRLSELDFE